MAEASAPSPDLSLVIPAYNEVERIGATLEAIRSYLDAKGLSFEVIVVAEGDDGTREAAASRAAADRRIAVVGGPERRGKGRGVREGVARAAGRIVGFLDADYKTPIEESEKLLPWFDAGYDVVVGSRALPESRVGVPAPLYRRLGSRVFGAAVRSLLGLREIRDTQCGFKFFRHAVAKDLFSRQRVDGYMFDVEVLLLARRSGYRIREVGVSWRDDGDTRLRLSRDVWRNLLDMARIRLRTAGSVAPPRSGTTAA